MRNVVGLIALSFGIVMTAVAATLTFHPPFRYWLQDRVHPATYHLVALIPDGTGNLKAVLTDTFQGRGSCMEHLDLVISEMRRIGEQGPSAAEASRIWLAERTMYCLSSEGTT
jgi:hypothetical protein